MKPPVNPPTVKVGVPNLVGIAKNIYCPGPQLTVKLHALLLVKVLFKDKIKSIYLQIIGVC